MLDYHLRIFLIFFFSCLGAALVLIIPLVVVVIMNLTKEDGVRGLIYGRPLVLFLAHYSVQHVMIIPVR